ncbi:hypothetical protein BTR23_17375 [Alkalihalophilus pseudofirmus]|nr:hypothetical protein BTR23_17375 [Alkalihalophilus pseudofirmus]
MIVLLLIGVNSLYKRYVPVFGLSYIELENILDEETVLLDIRDYLQAYKKPIPGAFNIPLAYIKRNYRELNGKTICIIGSNMLDITLGTRFLKRKDIKVIGYYIVDKKCKNQLNSSDRREIRGIH